MQPSVAGGLTLRSSGRPKGRRLPQTLDFNLLPYSMDKRTSDRKKRRLHDKRVGLVLLYLAVAGLFSWLSIRLFNSMDCEFFGSKLALLIVPACEVLGNRGAAILPVTVACVAFVMAGRSYFALENLTGCSMRPPSAPPERRR